MDFWKRQRQIWKETETDMRRDRDGRDNDRKQCFLFCTLKSEDLEEI